MGGDACVARRSPLLARFVRIEEEAGDAGKDDGKMLCSFCGKAVDPEGHRWECPRREPAP